MKKSIKNQLARNLGCNVSLNKKSLRIMSSLHEVMTLLKIDTNPKGKKRC